MRERRDIVSGEIMPEARLIRFVAAPDGAVVPDVAASLPGRGLWVSASKAERSFSDWLTSRTRAKTCTSKPSSRASISA